MTSKVKTRRTTKIIAIFLIAVFSFMSTFSMSASAAMSSFWRGGDIFATNSSATVPFDTGDCNKITLSAGTTLKYGSHCTAILQLQKKVMLPNEKEGWQTVKYDYITSNREASNLYHDFPIESYSTYRILCSLDTTDSLSVVNISMGIVIFS